MKKLGPGKLLIMDLC